MTATSNTFDCGGAQIRAHFRHLAMIITMRGNINAVNVDQVIDRTRRFILAHDPLVLDMSRANSSAEQTISLMQMVAEDCRAAGIEWKVVPSPAVTDSLRRSGYDDVFPTARSVNDALHQFADVIDERRQLLLPLVRKTA
jgi:anti-anti-sigma regulatory factor